MGKTATTKDPRPVAKLHYNCCLGFYLRGPKGGCWDASTRGWKAKAEKYRIDLSGHREKDVPGWVAQSRKISRENRP